MLVFFTIVDHVPGCLPNCNKFKTDRNWTCEVEIFAVESDSKTETFVFNLDRSPPGDGTVRYAVTAPGVYGAAVAFAAELAISFILMITVLLVTNHERLARYTPYCGFALRREYHV